MKKKLITFLLFFVVVISLTSCTQGIITKISDEVEYTKIENDITSVYERVSKGCVGLAVSNKSVSATGSGVIYKYDEDKSLYYVVTNAHVVEDMTNIAVYFGNSKYVSAKCIGYDTKNDIAVVTFNLDLLTSSLKDEIYVNDFFNYDDNDLVSVGQSVLAIGCPLGLDNFNILTTGVVSSVSKLSISTDAAINPGNSGGGLFNLEGRLIGINGSKEIWTYSQSESGYEEQIPVEGRGFAIALDLVKTCIEDIEKSNSIIERPLLGVSVATVNTVLNPDNEYSKYLPVSDDCVYFVIASFSSLDSAAKKCGVNLYDVILEINGNKVTTMDDISYALNTITLDDSLQLKVYRLINNEPTTTTLTITFK